MGAARPRRTVDCHLKDRLFVLPWKKPDHPQQDQDKSQRLESLLRFKVPPFRSCRRLLSGISFHRGRLAPTQTLFISGSLLGLCLESARPSAACLLGPRDHTRLNRRACKCSGESITMGAKETEKLPPGGPLPRGC